MQILGDPVGGIRKHVHGVILGLSPSEFLTSYAFGMHPDGSFGGELAAIREHTIGMLALKVRKYPHYSDLCNISLLAHYVRSNKVEIVHGHGAKGGLYARIVSRLCGIKSVYTPHGGSVHPMFSAAENALFGMVEKALFRSTDAFLFESQYTAETYHSRVRRQSGFSVINYNGVTIPELAAVAHRAQRLNDRKRFPKDFHVGIFGLLRYQKGQEIGVRAVAELVREGAPVMLHIYGDGPDRGNLEQLGRSLGLGERVCFHGHVTDPEAHMYWMDLIVVPSLFESFGYVAAEAMSLRKPVVASCVGGLREIVENGRTGLLVEAGDIQKLKNAIAFCMENEGICRSFTEAGYQRFLNLFTYDRMIRNISDVYHTLAGR